MKIHHLLLALCLTAGTLSSYTYADKPAGQTQQTKTGTAKHAAISVTAKPYKDVSILAQEYKYGQGRFDKFENPTGIFVQEGDKLNIVLRNTPSTEISLLIRSFEAVTVNSETLIPLQKGVNRITAPHEGLTYIRYFTKDGKGRPVKLSIKGGTDNGVYRKGDGADKWQKLLNTPGSEYIDIVGTYVHLIYNKEGLRENCGQDVEPLLAIYDDIIRELHTVMGLFKYNRWYGNHLNGRNGEKGFMYADGNGAYYSKDSMWAVTKLDVLDYWAIAHEFGHTTQLEPGLCWHGTKEVTNNIFSSRVRLKHTPEHLPLEDNVSPTPDGDVAGGCYSCFFQGAIINGEPFRYQMGPSNMSNYRTGTGGDVFVSLIPFWQLDLYYHYAGLGNRDLYPDICEKLREDTDDKNLTPGESQVRFCMYACDAAQQNLMPYFKQVGLLREVDRIIEDYAGKVPMRITADMVKKAERYGAKYPEPASPVIYLISAHSLDTFRNKAALEGTPGKGARLDGAWLIVDQSQWKNAVAYRTYAGDQLIRICIPGTGDSSKETTRCAFPEGATRVEAVGWDGSTLTVFDKSETNCQPTNANADPSSAPTPLKP